MRILLLAMMLALAGCANLPPNAPPVSPTTNLITPDGSKVPCTVLPNGMCVQP